MTRLNYKKVHIQFDEIKSFIRKVEFIFEIMILSFIFFLIWKFMYHIPLLSGGGYILILIYAFIMFMLFLYSDAFKFGYMKFTDIIISQGLSIIILNCITYFQICLIANNMISFFPIILMTVIDIAVAFLLSLSFTAIYHKYCVPKHMIMLYGRENSLLLKKKMDQRKDKYCIERMIYCDDYTSEEIITEFENYDAVILNDIKAELRNKILKYCYGNSIRVYSVPILSDVIYSGSKDITLFDTPLKLIHGCGLSLVQRFVKRTMDLIFCLTAMIPSSFIMLIVAAAIKLEDGGTVFYRQKRVTRNGKKFDILKFRSMIEDAESDGKPHPAIDNDNRITKVGKVIRALRIDELPQLLNIIKGDMSIVGPRPERVEHCEIYRKDIPEFEFRNKVKGGLTGYAQVYGKYNTTAIDKLRLDLMYIENYSFALDIKIILMTLRILFKKESTEGFYEADSRLKEIKEKELLRK